MYLLWKKKQKKQTNKSLLTELIKNYQVFFLKDKGFSKICLLL